MNDNSIKVVFRFRQEPPDAQFSSWEIDQNSLTLANEKNTERRFEFDAVLPPDTIQESVYEDHAKVGIECFLSGFNSTIFAYGQTGSGKTFTMIGPESVTEQFIDNSKQNLNECSADFGIIPRSIHTIFKAIEEGKNEKNQYILKCSYLEVYNENVHDILLTQVGCNLKIREVPGIGMQVMGLQERFLMQPEHVFECLAIGLKNRAVCSTGANARSSRSHTVFIINLEQKSPEGEIKLSRLNLVDLAGSEKLAKSQTTGVALEETKKINQSLTCLGMCIQVLSSKKKSHVPYRDSKLTLILKESLGGNSKTLMMCTGSMLIENEEETVQSLRFATRAKKIINKAKNNIKRTIPELENLAESLEKEVIKLRALLKQSEIKQNNIYSLNSNIYNENDFRVGKNEVQDRQNKVSRLEVITDIKDYYEQNYLESPFSQGLKRQFKLKEDERKALEELKQKLESDLEKIYLEQPLIKEQNEMKKQELNKQNEELISLNWTLKKLENELQILQDKYEQSQMDLDEQEGLSTKDIEDDRDIYEKKIEDKEKQIDELKDIISNKLSILSLLMKSKKQISKCYLESISQQENIEKQLQVLLSRLQQHGIQEPNNKQIQF